MNYFNSRKNTDQFRPNYGLDVLDLVSDSVISLNVTAICNILTQQFADTGIGVVNIQPKNVDSSQILELVIETPSEKTKVSIGVS